MAFQWWELLSNHGIDADSEIEQIRQQRLANQVLLFFIGLGIFSIIEGFSVLPFLIEDGFLPQNIAGYIIAQSILMFFLFTSYVAIAKTKRISWVLLAHSVGLVYVLAMSLMIGYESNFHLLLIAMAPLPFFFYQAIPTSILLLSQVVLWSFLVFAMWWHGPHTAFFPLPGWYMNFLGFQSVSIVILCISACTYYMWRQNRSKEKVILDAHARLKAFNDTMQMELDFAQAIQADIFPRVKEWQKAEFAYCYQPLVKVSGDYFDIFTYENRVFVAMVDVSGHGVPAALVTMLAKRLFGHFSSQFENPADVLTEVNLELVKQLRTSDFLTTFAFTLDSTGKMIYANGGHCYPFLVRANSGEVLALDTKGPPLGITDDPAYGFHFDSTELRAGDTVHLFTDGFTEQVNSENKQFGLDRLKELLIEGRSLPMSELQEKVIAEVDAYRGAEPIEDDRSLLSCRWA